MKIKVCGLRESDDVIALSNTGIDYMGFIFYEGSPRYARYSLEESTLKYVPKTTRKVGVFVNADTQEILETVGQFGLDMIQLHGEESPETCALVREQLPVLKAFRVDEVFDFETETGPYAACCDYFLFDAAGNAYGGNGIRFGWELLTKYTLRVPFLVGGGIAPQHAHELMQLYHPQLLGCDINSRFEILPGKKDLRQVKTFVKSLKSSGYELPGH